MLCTCTYLSGLYLSNHYLHHRHTSTPPQLWWMVFCVVLFVHKYFQKLRLTSSITSHFGDDAEQTQRKGSKKVSNDRQHTLLDILRMYCTPQQTTNGPASQRPQVLSAPVLCLEPDSSASKNSIFNKPRGCKQPKQGMSCTYSRMTTRSRVPAIHDVITLPRRPSIINLIFSHSQPSQATKNKQASIIDDIHYFFPKTITTT